LTYAGEAGTLRHRIGCIQCNSQCFVSDKRLKQKEHGTLPVAQTLQVLSPHTLPDTNNEAESPDIPPTHVPTAAAVLPPTHRLPPAYDELSVPTHGTKRKFTPKSRAPNYFEDTPSESENGNHSGDGNSSGNSFSDAPPRVKRPRTSTVVTRSSGRNQDTPQPSLAIPGVNTSIHWGQGPVYRAGTSQVHRKEMDSVPCMCPPSTSQIFSEFSLLVSP